MEAEGPTPERGATALTCAFPGSPPVAQHPKGKVAAKGARRGAELGQWVPRGVALLCREGGTEVLAGGTGREKDLLDLAGGGHFPGFGIWPRPSSPKIPAPISFLPSHLGCFCALAAAVNSGRCSWNGALFLWLPEQHPVPVAAAGQGGRMRIELWNRSFRRWKRKARHFIVGGVVGWEMSLSLLLTSQR